MRATLGERIEALVRKHRGPASAPLSPFERGSNNPSRLRESLRADQGASGAKPEQRACRAEIAPRPSLEHDGFRMFSPPFPSDCLGGSG
jgi:hypothetical protein